MEYVETNCTVEHEGKKFEASGAFVSADFIVGYLGKDGVLTDWHGNKIGQYWITSTWKTPRSYVSYTMHQVGAYVDGVFYTGRSAGEGMCFKGKRSAKQN